MDPDASIPSEPAPSVFSYVLSFLLVGVAWGFTTPFIRRAAADFNARQEKQSGSSEPQTTRGRSQIPSQGIQEEQELLPTDPQEEGEEGENGMRRRSGSQQRQVPPSSDGDAAAGDEDNIPSPAWMQSPAPRQSWLKAKVVSIFWTVVNLLRTPAYSVPLVINLTGSIWFFLLVGKHGKWYPSI